MVCRVVRCYVFLLCCDTVWYIVALCVGWLNCGVPLRCCIPDCVVALRVCRTVMVMQCCMVYWCAVHIVALRCVVLLCCFVCCACACCRVMCYCVALYVGLSCAML